MTVNKRILHFGITPGIHFFFQFVYTLFCCPVSHLHERKLEAGSWDTNQGVGALYLSYSHSSNFLIAPVSCTQVPGLRTKLGSPAFILKWSNLTTLKPGLYNCSHVPKNSSVDLLRIQFLIISAARDSPSLVLAISVKQIKSLSPEVITAMSMF